MLPSPVILALPALFLVTLLLLALYHTLPLIHILPRPGPLVARLATIVPRPRLPLSKKQHLPREFFNLPPRPDTPSHDACEQQGADEDKLTVGAVLGVRGKLVMLLVTQGGVALICGWMVLAAELALGSVAGNALAGLAVLLLPSTVFTMVLYAAMTRSVHDAPRTGLGKLLGYGGITHETIFPRIAPVSTALALASTAGGIGAGAMGGTVITAISVALASLSLALALGARLRRRHAKRSGAIRLAFGSPERDVASSMGMDEKRVYRSQSELRALRDTDSWLDSPSTRPPTPGSPFSYSPSLAQRSSAKTLAATTLRSKSSGHPTPKTIDSEMSDWTTTPRTMSEWDLANTPSDSASPESVEYGRAASRAGARRVAANETHSMRTASISTGIPRGSATSQWTQTLTSTPGSGLRGAGGSVLGGYSPNLYQHMPRGFESLASLGHRARESAETPFNSYGTGHAGSTSPGSMAIHHAERHVTSRAASSRTLHSYYFAAIQNRDHAQYPTEEADRPETAMSLAYTTPRNQIRQSRQSHRAPPPPPMPVDMPLPPTPAAAKGGMSRSSRQTLGSSLWTRAEDDGEDIEGQWMELDDEWVDVTGSGEELESWGRGGRGVGILGLICITVCTALAAPLLLTSLGDMTSTLFLVSVLLPTPCIILTSYLLRPRPLPYPTQPHNLKKGSTTSVSTHKSLALQSESQLSLPATISPKLTPPLRKKPSVPIVEKWNKLLPSKPSISNFGYATTRNAAQRKAQDLRRQTIVGAALAAQAAKEDDENAEEAMRRNMSRRSADLWMQAGHARPASTRFERAKEMIKPAPALCMMDGQETPVPKRQSAMLIEADGVVRRMSSGMALLSQRVSQVFGAQGQGERSVTEAGVELSQFVDADSAVTSRRRVQAEMGGRPEIQITSPSKFDRRHSAMSSVQTHTDDAHDSPGRSADGHEGAGDEAMGEIQTARRGRMSAGPMLIYGGLRSPTSPVEQTFPRTGQARPTSDQFADAESPRKRHTLVVSNIVRSSETNLASGPSLSGADLVPPVQRRQSASLPPHDKTSFTSLRGQLDQCGKRGHNLSIYADADEDLVKAQPEPKSAWPLVNPASTEESRGDVSGVDLPAFPVDFVSPSFSPASQAVRTPARSRTGEGEGDAAQMTARTRSLARLTLTASAYYDAASPLSQAKVVRPSAPPAVIDNDRMAPPAQSHGDRSRVSTDSANMPADDSFISEASAMAHQMEDVLHMDSPTRAEFVISPQPSMASIAGSNRSSWAAGRLSRASSTGSLLNRAASFGRSASPWEFDPRMQQQAQHRYSQQYDRVAAFANVGPGTSAHAPVQRQASLASIASSASGWAEASGSTYAGSGSAADFSIIGQWEVAPPVPDLPPNLRRPVSQGAFSAVVHAPIIETPPTPASAASVADSVASTPARPANAQSGLRPSSIALPDQATLAALIPGQLNKRDSALLGRHPSIMDLQQAQADAALHAEAGHEDIAPTISATPVRRVVEGKKAGQGHTSRSSVDTIKSSVSLDTDAGSYWSEDRRERETPEWRMSKQDIERVQQFKDRVRAGEDITRMSLSAPPREPVGAFEGAGREMSDGEEASEDQFEDASDDEPMADDYGTQQRSASPSVAATPPRPARAQPTSQAPSPAGSFAPSAYGRFANADEAALGRVGKEVRSIEARAAGSLPPSPAKSFARSLKSSKSSSNLAAAASGSTPPAEMEAASNTVISAAANEVEAIREEPDVTAAREEEVPVPIRGLRPLRLLANRPPSIIGASRATQHGVNAGLVTKEPSKRSEEAPPRRSGSLGKRSDTPGRRYGKPKSSIGPMEVGKKGKGSYASNASGLASKENLPLNINGTPKATPKATPARRRGSKKGSMGPSGGIRA